MNFSFRVDSSTMIGSGHLMRCLTIANELRGRGHNVQFITRSHTGNLNSIVELNHYCLKKLPAPTRVDKPAYHEVYSDWLGVPQIQDAQETVSALNGQMQDCMIVDHYGIDKEWETFVRPYVKKVMVIDDLSNRHHNCDVILDQNFSKEQGRYAQLVPKSCRMALGPKFALIHPYYRNYRTLRVRDGIVRKIFVFFGGSDPNDLTSLALDVLMSDEFSQVHVDLVLGVNHKNSENIIRNAELRPLTRIHKNLPHLADLMMAADLAIGGGGVTTWERICSKLPSIVIILAENQRPACEALGDAGYLINLGKSDPSTKERLRKELLACLSMPERMVAFASRMNDLVDGRGPLRVIEILESF